MKLDTNYRKEQVYKVNILLRRTYTSSEIVINLKLNIKHFSFLRFTIVIFRVFSISNSIYAIENVTYYKLCKHDLSQSSYSLNLRWRGRTCNNKQNTKSCQKHNDFRMLKPKINGYNDSTFHIPLNAVIYYLFMILIY